jgi:hypothetical protein
MNETSYRNQLQIDLSSAGFRMFRNNTGVFYTAEGIPTRAGLCKGSGDLIGLSPCGRFISIETKSLKGRKRPEQISWADMVNSMNGIAIFCKPGDDVINILKSKLNM